MSSSPIEAAAPPGTTPPRTAARGGRRPRSPGLIKRLLPRTLFGRAFLILVVTLLLVQGVAISFFYDRLWDTVMRRLSSSVAGDIGLVIEASRLLPSDDARARLLAVSHGATGLTFEVLPNSDLPPDRESGGLIERQLSHALDALPYPYRVDDDSRSHEVRVLIAVGADVIRVEVPESRLWSSTSYIFFLWMGGTSLLTLLIGTMFLRNQVRSLRRLAVAAEAFGKGRDVPNFRPEGAQEVRQAAAAFLLMRERIQRQISQRTEMLAGVSHDLRTPLTRMKLELALLGESEEIRGLRSDVAEMETMVEGYLDFARGEGAEQSRVVDLVPLLGGVVANGRRDGADVVFEGPADCHFPVRPDALRRAVANLVGNASRHARHVFVTLIPARQSVSILIDDDGPGIPEHLRETVFRPFLRLEGSRNRATGGVGLGLTIARDIVRSHGGDLTLETAPQGGLRARIYLPR